MDSDRKETKIYRGFIVSISLIVALCISGIFLGMAFQSRALIYEEILARGQSHFNSIVLARKWNAHYGGVYVEKKEGVPSNPYLENPDITGLNGKTYTMKNPALMTREISEYAEKEGLFKFHITSLKPINPGNKPDPFESDALLSFENNNIQETFKQERIGDKLFYRYMAPLKVEKPCLACHAKQGYQVGDIRGGISVSFDIDSVHKRLRKNIILIIIFGTTTIFLLLGIISFYFLRLRTRLNEARKMLETMATTDILTGLYNRRHLMVRFEEEFSRSKRSGRPLGCIMMDIDHFKTVNDTYGHLAGDAVLKDLSAALQKVIRPYDTIGRYGGEEFMVVLPDITLENIVKQAERIRATVEKSVFIGFDMDRKNITVSLGVSVFRTDDDKISTIIQRADDALYKAKESGRNRVETY